MMLRKIFGLMVLLGMAAAVGGCAFPSFPTPLHIEPVSKKVGTVTPKFSDHVYYYDRDHNLYFILRSFGSDPDTGKPVQQIMMIRVFWHPAGGKTTLDPTAMNATYRYLVITPDAIGMYEGAGFVRMNGKDGKAKLKARVIQGDLRLTEASANFVDTIGRARIKGYFTTEYDDVHAMDMWLAAHREFFARSLVSKPGAPARQDDSDFYEPGGVAPDMTPLTQPATSTAPASQPTTGPMPTTQPDTLPHSTVELVPQTQAGGTLPASQP